MWFFFCRDRNSLIISSRPHVDVFVFLIPVLVTLVAANVEGTNKPLFEKHGIIMWSFLVELGGYCIALVADVNCRIHQSNSSVAAADHTHSRIHQQNLSVAADTNSPNHEANTSRINSLIAVIFGLLSTVSLVSTLVPPVVGYIILSISWICAPILVVVVYEDGKLYKGACRWIYKYFMVLVLTSTRKNNWFHEARNSNMVISSHSTEQSPAAISDIV